MIEQGLGWGKIAEIVERHRNSLANWRDPQSEHYVEEFALMVTAAEEEFACNKTKAGQKAQAIVHTLKKVTRVARVIDIRSKKSKLKLPPPNMPPSSYKRGELIHYANLILDLTFPENYTINDMRTACVRRIAELSTEVMVKVSVIETEVGPNPQAVKNVLSNCGNKDKRWSFTQEMKVGGEVQLLPPNITKHEGTEDENRST